MAPFNVEKSVMLAWCRYNFDLPENMEYIADQYIMHNSLIRRKGKPISQDIYKGLQSFKIQHLLDKEGKFLEYYEFCEKFSEEILMLDYHGIKAAIPTVWKQSLLENFENENEEYVGKFESMLGKKLVKKVYWESIQKKKKSDGCRIAWSSELATQIDEEQWSQFYIKICQVTNSVKLRYFFYRVINRTLVTNVKLFQWKMTNTDQCTFCNQKKETIIHLFWECEESSRLWQCMSRWIDHFLQIKVTFQLDMIMLNNYGGARGQIINTFILLTKYYIYSCKCLDVQLNFASLMQKVYYIKRIEHLTAFQNNKLVLHEKKWKFLT